MKPPAKQTDREFLDGLDDLRSNLGVSHPEPRLSTDQVNRLMALAFKGLTDSRWLPISSAPKDGTRILGFRDGDLADIHWVKKDRQWGNRRRGWTYGGDPANQPTHWMPIMADPEVKP